MLAGPDRLHGLIGTIFRFREGPLALNADIDSMFLQEQFPKQDKCCLRFFWRPTIIKIVQKYEYHCHVFGANSLPTCVNYALKRVVIANEDQSPIAAKAIQIFYMDNFIKSIHTPDEAINVFKQLQPLLLKHVFELKNWITNCSKLTEEFSEDMKSISNIMQVEVVYRKVGSSVVLLQCTDGEDSLQICRGASKN